MGGRWGGEWPGYPVRMSKPFALALLASAFLVACQSSQPSDAAEPEDSGPAGTDFVYVNLMTGPNAGQLEDDALQDAMAGHFSNMARMAEEGHLLVAGPFGPPRAVPRLRGLFILDTADVEEGRKLASTDPAAQAGVFELEVYSWRSPSPLRELPRLNREAEEARAAAGEETFQGRPYVILTAEDGDAGLMALRPLVEGGQVLFHGRFLDDGEGAHLFCLDVESIDEARSLIPERSRVEFRFHPWYSTDVLEKLNPLSSASGADG